MIVAVVLTLAPWLSGPAFIAGFFGFGVMGFRIIRSVLDALPDEHKEPFVKAEEVGVDVPGITTAPAGA